MQFSKEVANFVCVQKLKFPNNSNYYKGNLPANTNYSRGAVMRSLSGCIRRGFRKSQAKACVDKCHSRLDLGRVLCTRP